MPEDYTLPQEVYEEEGALENIEGDSDSHYLALARSAFEESDSFLDRAHKTRWIRNYKLAQSEHPPGSKYLSSKYLYKSKAFRGKTEAAIRKNEAALAVAMYSSRDAVSLNAENSDDPQQDDAAEALHRLVNYRLDRSIKWFLIGIGAYHEAMINGDVVSEQYWDYVENGSGEVVKDMPAVVLHPLEHVHVSPNADWLDPINSSPYLIIEFPMFVADVKAKMKRNGGDWRDYEDGEILRALKTHKHEEVDQARDKDSATADSGIESSVTDFRVVYVHKNLIRDEGKELAYYTLGSELLLSEPEPIEKMYPHVAKTGKRPFVWGTATVEPHKIYRRSLVDRVATTQSQSNDIANQRFDNVKQVLNKRKYAKRNSGIDYAALMKNIDGQVILMDEIDAVKEETVTDVTGSSYQEQNMINIDFDELAGSFSNSSVASNRQLNETVGGMNMLSANANILTEYQMRVFVETWVEPVIVQITELEQFYEDDEVIQRITKTDHTHESIQMQIEARVSAGFGSTDPAQKIQRLVYGIQAIAQIAPQMAGQLDGKEISEEIFAALGYNDGNKFFQEEQEDPKVMQLMQVIQELQKAIETEKIKTENEYMKEARLKQMDGQQRAKELVLKLHSERQIKLTQMALDRGMKLKELKQKAGFDSDNVSINLLKELNRRMDVENKSRELAYKVRTGNEGI